MAHVGSLFLALHGLKSKKRGGTTRVKESRERYERSCRLLKSRRIVTLIVEDLTKIKPTEPLIKVSQVYIAQKTNLVRFLGQFSGERIRKNNTKSHRKNDLKCSQEQVDHHWSHG